MSKFVQKSVGVGITVGLFGTGLILAERARAADFENVVTSAKLGGIGMSAIDGYRYNTLFSGGKFQGKDSIILTLGSCVTDNAEYMVSDGVEPDDISVAFRIPADIRTIESTPTVVNTLEDVQLLPGYDSCF